MHVFFSFSPDFSCKMANFLQFTMLQTSMATTDQRGIAAKLPKPTASRRSRILLCGSCPCAFTPSKLKNRMIMDGMMDMVSRVCQNCLEPALYGANQHTRF
jgi:hypothetical protein